MYKNLVKSICKILLLITFCNNVIDLLSNIFESFVLFQTCKRHRFNTLL